MIIMTVIPQLASSQQSRGEAPNEELAKKIVDRNDKNAVKELVENLGNKNKNIQSDCIKVLYEAGSLKPALISTYVKDFISLLDHKNNRIQWGAMIALDHIAKEDPDTIFKNLARIIIASDKGSVITRDHAVNILITLCRQKRYAEDSFSLLIEQLMTSPANQLPKYAEDALPVVSEKNKKIFLKTLNSRLSDIEKDSKKKRVEKVIKKLS
jgi:hypothetical protein